MKLEHIQEPRLLFAKGEHICPRRGISAYGVFDQSQTTRRKDIYIGGIGSNNCLELLDKWFELCRSVIDAPEGAKQTNLKLPFCGFNSKSGFGSELHFSGDLSRSIRNVDIEDIIKIQRRTERIETAIALYFENIKFLAQNRHVDVIVCVIPEQLYKAISTDAGAEEESLDVGGGYEELNFRRALKAKSMMLGKPLHLIRAVSLDST